MRFVVAAVMLLFIWAKPAAADLYRWVDPETGSVKFSSYPPLWYGDEAKQRHSPKVEVIPAGSDAPAQRAEPAKAQDSGKGREAGIGSGFARIAEALEARRKALLEVFTVIPPATDFNRAGSGIRQQLEAYQALSAELDRMDPKGAERRNAEARPVMERIAEGLRAQFGTVPQPQQARER